MIKIKDYEGTSISANLFRGIESVGGEIHFTNDRLIFKSHSLNLQTGETEIKYKNISSADNRKTLAVIPNGIKLTLKDGEEYDFVVKNRTSILEFLDSQIEKEQ